VSRWVSRRRSTHPCSCSYGNLRAQFVSFNFPNSLICGTASRAAAVRLNVPARRRPVAAAFDRKRVETVTASLHQRCPDDRIFKIDRNALSARTTPSRHGIARSEGALLRASRADGGGSAIIRGTSTPDLAKIEADRTGRVYRVSHVVDGEFMNLLRRNHSDHYHFATG